MSQNVNFKLKEVINSTVDTRYKAKQPDNLASFYEKRNKDSSLVGRNSTYDVVGKRNYKTLFDDKKFKW